MASKMVLAVCVMVALVAMVECLPAAQPAAAGGWGPPGVNPFIPPWVAAAPWMPQWSLCSTVGSACADCSTKTICTKIGGLLRPCTDPLLPYCNLGECSATPSAECAPAGPVPAVPAQTA